MTGHNRAGRRARLIDQDNARFIERCTANRLARRTALRFPLAEGFVERRTRGRKVYSAYHVDRHIVRCHFLFMKYLEALTFNRRETLRVPY